jgi:hypothetical protein
MARSDLFGENPLIRSRLLGKGATGAPGPPAWKTLLAENTKGLFANAHDARVLSRPRSDVFQSSPKTAGRRSRIGPVVQHLSSIPRKGNRSTGRMAMATGVALIAPVPSTATFRPATQLLICSSPTIANTAPAACCRRWYFGRHGEFCRRRGKRGRRPCRGSKVCHRDHHDGHPLAKRHVSLLARLQDEDQSP